MPFKNNFIYLFLLFTFDSAGFLFLHVAFSSCSRSGLERCVGSSLWCFILLLSMDSRVHGLQQLRHVSSEAAALELYSTGSIVVARRLSCFTARGIFPGQGSNLCLFSEQVDSLSHQGSPNQHAFVVKNSTLFRTGGHMCTRG